MFRRLRWKITLWFMLLSGLVYLVTTGVGLGLFWNSLNDSISDEMDALFDEIKPALTMVNGRLASPTEESKHWDKVSFRQPVSIQIFDREKKLIRNVGLNGDERLYPENEVVETKAEDGNFRSRSFPVMIDSATEGYVQVQVSTKHRDDSVHGYIATMAWMAPLVLLALAVGGYAFSGKAVLPVEQSYSALKSFLADAGHELGTPLAIIQASADNLSMDIDDEAARDRVDVITRTTERMNRLVGDMSMLAKLKATQFVERRDNVSLDALVRDLVNDFEDLFEEKKIQIVKKIEPAAIHADAQEIAKVVSNLMQNALRYTDGGGTVTVSVSAKDNKATLIVEDTGVGISQEDLPHIFDRFYRVDKSRSRAKGGSGLGLAIVQAIVEGHKGTIDVTSTEGKGTTFTITIPQMN